MAVDPNIKKKVDDIRNKIYGKEVRESLASGLEAMSSDVVENEGRQSVVEGRQDSVESQWQSVIDETTNLDVVSAPEIIAARNGESNLKARLDKENQEVTTQLAQTVKALGTVNIGENIKRPAISIITDDGYIADIDYLLPISVDKGVPFNTAIITDRIDESVSYALNAEDIRMLQDEYGWEIMSHTCNHSKLDTLTYEQQEEQISLSKEILEDIGAKVETMVYPYGAYNDDTLEITKKYYRSGRSTDFGLFGGINNAPIDTYALNVIWLDSNANNPSDPSGLPINTTDYYEHYIDLAIAKNGWLIILLHSNDTEAADLGPILEHAIDYGKSKGVDFLTFNKALDRFGSSIDVGKKIDTAPHKDHFSVGMDGKVSSNYAIYKRAENNAYDGLSDIEEFEVDVITINRVNTATASSSGLPEKIGGILTTFKLDRDLGFNPIYNYQEYLTVNTNNTYRRSINTSGNWGTWKKITATNDIDTSGYDTSTRIEYFPLGITINHINDTKAEQIGAPENKGGTLTTYKATGSAGFSYQEYTHYGTSNTFRRTFSDRGTPTDFKVLRYKKRFATSWTEVVSNETVDIDITSDLFTKDNVVSVTPKGTIPKDIIFLTIVSEGNLRIRLINTGITASLQPMDWVVSIT